MLLFVQGDSGGSVNCRGTDGKYYVAGIASFGINEIINGEACCIKDYPAIYTSTCRYLDWIQSHM